MSINPKCYYANTIKYGQQIQISIEEVFET